MKFLRIDPDKGYLSNNLWIPKKHINIDGTKAALTFYPTKRGKEESGARELWLETQHHLLVPREFWKISELPFEVIDIRPQHYQRVDIKSRIQLDFVDNSLTTQRDALEALRSAHGGVLQLACGLGKTVIALELVARLKVPALIVLENSQLFEQWRQEIAKHLTLPDELGIIGGGQFVWERSLVIATYKTLAMKSKELPEHIRKYFGVVIWDEGHHVDAPTYSLTADMFYGRRFVLTATPERSDGMHVLHSFHMGQVLYKNLKQRNKPRIEFYWTGIKPDLANPEIEDQICSVTGEVHLMMLASYFATQKSRIELTINLIKKWRSEDRKIIILSYSVAELVNLYCIWSGKDSLYSDVNIADIKTNIEPLELSEGQFNSCTDRLKNIQAILKAKTLKSFQEELLEGEAENYQLALDRHNAFLSIQKELKKRQSKYIKEVTANTSAGLLIGKVDPEERHKMLRKFPVVFAIMKYGVEGLDDPAIDTVLALESPSKEGGIRQMMGRALRDKAGKQEPLMAFLEDDVDIIKGICGSVRKILRHWPSDQGGPLNYKLVGYTNKGEVR